MTGAGESGLSRQWIWRTHILDRLSPASRRRTTQESGTDAKHYRALEA